MSKRTSTCEKHKAVKYTYDRLLSGPNFLLAKLAVLKHLTQWKTRIKMFYVITGQLKLKQNLRHIWGGT